MWELVMDYQDKISSHIVKLMFLFPKRKVKDIRRILHVCPFLFSRDIDKIFPFIKDYILYPYSYSRTRKSPQNNEHVNDFFSM